MKFAQDSASLLITNKEGKSKSQTNGQDEEGFKIGGLNKLEDKFAFKKGSPPNANESTLEFQLCRTLLCRISNIWCVANSGKLIIQGNCLKFKQILWQPRALKVKCFLRGRNLMQGNFK